MRARTANLLLLAGAVIASLLVAEVSLRLLNLQPGFITGDHPPEGWIPHDERGYAFAPDFRGQIRRGEKRIELRTNHLGMRESRVEDLSGDVILAVGNSFTAGWGISRAEAWPARLEGEIARRGGTTRVLNGGVHGYGLRQIRLYAAELMDRLEPRLLIVGVYVNAAYRIADPLVYHGYGHGLIRKSWTPKLRPVKGGYLMTPMYRTWMRELDFWLGERFFVGGTRFAAHTRFGPGSQATDRRSSGEVKTWRGQTTTGRPWLRIFCDCWPKSKRFARRRQGVVYPS